MYNIIWKPKAARQLEKIRDLKIRNEIFDTVSVLSIFPKCQNIKPLKNHGHDYRLRVGRYRVLFDLDKVIHVINIEEVKRRDEKTY